MGVRAKLDGLECISAKAEHLSCPNKEVPLLIPHLGNSSSALDPPEVQARGEHVNFTKTGQGAAQGLQSQTFSL